MALQHIHDHVARHMGAGFDLRMLYMYFVRLEVGRAPPVDARLQAQHHAGGSPNTWGR